MNSRILKATIQPHHTDHSNPYLCLWELVTMSVMKDNWLLTAIINTSQMSYHVMDRPAKCHQVTTHVALPPYIYSKHCQLAIFMLRRKKAPGYILSWVTYKIKYMSENSQGVKRPYLGHKVILFNTHCELLDQSWWPQIVSTWQIQRVGE